MHVRVTDTYTLPSSKSVLKGHDVLALSSPTVDIERSWLTYRLEQYTL